MKSFLKKSGFFTFCMVLTAHVVAADYDLVINNGRVMDPETKYDKIANVGIKDGKIVAITKDKLKGKETINAKGLVVSPGFIDTHYHATDLFGAKLGVADGITTAMDLEHGATRIGEWYDNMAKRGAQVNYGSSYHPCWRPHVSSRF